jgi:hypothetical protein
LRGRKVDKWTTTSDIEEAISARDFFTSPLKVLSGWTANGASGDAGLVPSVCMLESPPLHTNIRVVSSPPDAGSDRDARLAKVRSELGRVARKHKGSMYALRLAVCSFTVELRDEGMKPEAVLIMFKEAINQISLEAPYATSTRPGANLHATLTTWCIEDYFAHERLSIPIDTPLPESSV